MNDLMMEYFRKKYLVPVFFCVIELRALWELDQSFTILPVTIRCVGVYIKFCFNHVRNVNLNKNFAHSTPRLHFT